MPCPCFDLPYLFPDAATARKALSGEAAQGQLDALESIGMKGINYWENGIYAIGAVKPVKNLADLKGMRVRSIDRPPCRRMCTAHWRYARGSGLG